MELKISVHLKKLLKERGESLKELSKKTHIPYSTLHGYTTGVHPKNISHIKRLAEHFEMGMHELLYLEKDPHELFVKIFSKKEFKKCFEISLREIVVENYEKK